MQTLTNLSDDALLHELHVIVGSHRRVTAGLILHLGEVDARRLHVGLGFSSLFSYCVELLRFSEDEACRRIEAARLARRFPAIYPLLETGAISLTVLGLLKPHLTPENHPEVLVGVSRSSVRQAKEWIATRFPQPDVPWSIRKHPERRASDGSPAAARVAQDGSPAAARVATEASPVSARMATEASPVSARVAIAHSARARVEPLSQDRFLVKFTASRAMKEKLEHARDLLLHANPTGALERVLERGLDLLIAELEKTKQGRASRPTERPRAAKRGAGDRGGAAGRSGGDGGAMRAESTVTRAVRREVVGRDGWRCSFVAEDGRRCDARGFLEFDHETPRGRGGGSGAENLRVLCRAHNRWAAERVYGAAHVSGAIADSQREKQKGRERLETVARAG